MVLLQSCPRCHRRQALKHNQCVRCQVPLDELREKQMVRYWIYYRHKHKQIYEPAGKSHKEAELALSKRRVQKAKKHLPEILQRKESYRATLSQISQWYLNLRDVRAKPLECANISANNPLVVQCKGLNSSPRVALRACTQYLQQNYPFSPTFSVFPIIQGIAKTDNLFKILAIQKWEKY